MAQPNILFVMADQMSAKALPFYGHPVVKTPALSRLAREGVQQLFPTGRLIHSGHERPSRSRSWMCLIN